MKTKIYDHRTDEATEYGGGIPKITGVDALDNASYIGCLSIDTNLGYSLILHFSLKEAEDMVVRLISLSHIRIDSFKGANQC